MFTIAVSEGGIREKLIKFVRYLALDSSMESKTDLLILYIILLG